MTRKAALFDMDRTLVRVDTGTLYVRYQRDNGEASLLDVARVAWWMTKYTLGIMDAEGVAEMALRAFKGKEEHWLAESCERWFVDYVLEHVVAAGRRAVKEHLERGDFVAIVTGATPYAARPLARELGIEHVIATRLEVNGGLFTGRVEHPMSYGSGKVVLSEKLAAEYGFALEESAFYSDSITDLPLLERVATPIAVNPDPRLRRHAQKKRWRIERW